MWMVFVEGRRTPVVVHQSEQDATAEAYRLQGKENRTAYVLKVICTIAPSPQPNGDDDGTIRLRKEEP